MIKLTAHLSVSARYSLAPRPHHACPAERAAFTESTPIRFAAWTIPVAAGDDEDGLSEATIAAAEDDASLEAAYSRRGAGDGAGDARVDAVAGVGSDRAAHHRARRRRAGASRRGAPSAGDDGARAPPGAGGGRAQPLVAGACRRSC